MDFSQCLRNFLQNYEKETGYRYVIYGYKCVGTRKVKNITKSKSIQNMSCDNNNSQPANNLSEFVGILEKYIHLK